MLQSIACRQLKTWVIDPSSTLYYRWLAVISAACLYNLIMIIARAVFWKLQEGNLLLTWLCLDYLCDVIYVLDIFVQFRTGQCCMLDDDVVSVDPGVQPLQLHVCC